jgi:hypothetical protein
MGNLRLIAQDLLYYGYNFSYFYANYCEGIDKQQALSIWEQERDRLSQTF